MIDHMTTAFIHLMKGDSQMHLFEQYVNPDLGRLLTRLKMDKEYVKGDGCWLFDRDGQRYLDMIASYGAVPFGHNPKEIWEALDQVKLLGEPGFVQPSSLIPAGELAALLLQIAPANLKTVTFTNSGTEAVEAGLKACRSATGRPGILATVNSFHGKTLGALSATGRSSYQEGFGAPVEGFSFIPYGDSVSLQNKFAENPGYYAAFIVEPIQGEGGIITPPAGYLQEVRRLCDKYGVLLILDEIQTGLGRTGRMFACEEESVSPDVMLVAKALGGGLLPIGACLCGENVYNERFALKHSSTFAGGTLACRAALAALERLTADDCRLVKHAAATGSILKNGLLSLQQKYPALIREVRGRGLFLGLDFGITRDIFPVSLLGIMAEQELLTPLISSYLLNVHKIRVAPTLNGNSVIRIEPPLVVTQEQCELTLTALDDMLETMASGNTARFLAYLLGKTVELKPIPFRKKGPLLACPSSYREEGRFAFLVHPVHIQNYPEFDESLAVFKQEELQAIAARWNDLVTPFLIAGATIHSKAGSKAYGEFICVPRTAEDLLAMPREEAVAQIREAALLGIKRGAKVIGLGAYTSVVTRGGQLLQDLETGITTGNTYTVVSAVEALSKAATRLGLSPGETTTAVVGAAGSIGRTAAALLAENSLRLILIGSPKAPVQSYRRLVQVAAEIVEHLLNTVRQGKRLPANTLGERLLRHPLCPLPGAAFEEILFFAKHLADNDEGFFITSDLHSVMYPADLILSATSSPFTLITPEILKTGAIICDISRPGNVDPRVQHERPDVLVIDGGIIEIPGRPNLGWDFGLNTGLAYSCMAETILLALEKRYETTALDTGIHMAAITNIQALAEKHGFFVAGLRSFNQPLTQQKWLRLLNSRNSAETISS